MKLSEVATNYNEISLLKKECNAAFKTFFKLQQEVNEIVNEKFQNNSDTDWESIKHYLKENGFNDTSDQDSIKFSCGELTFNFKNKSEIDPKTLCEFIVYLEKRRVFSGVIETVFTFEGKDVCSSKNTSNSSFMDEYTRGFKIVTKDNYEYYIEREIKYCSDIEKQVAKLQYILKGITENIEDFNRKIEKSSEWLRCYELIKNVRKDLWSTVEELFEGEINPSIYKGK